MSERRGGFEFFTPEAVHALVYLAWRIRHLGHLAPVMRTLTEPLNREPVRGDLVVETSTLGWPPDAEKYKNFARVGIFDRMELEPLEGADPEYRERAYYVTPLDATEPVRWVNCCWMVLPKTSKDVKD